MRTYSIPFVIVLALPSAFLSTACDSKSSTTPLQPTAVSSGISTADVAVAVRPTGLFRRPVPGALCPFQQPFAVPLELVVDNTSLSSASLNRVGFQFIDSVGAAGPQMMFDRPALDRRLGDVGLPPQSSRAFPFSFEFGCGTLPHGKIDVLISTIDERQVLRDRSSTVFVR